MLIAHPSVRSLAYLHELSGKAIPEYIVWLDWGSFDRKSLTTDWAAYDYNSFFALENGFEHSNDVLHFHVSSRDINDQRLRSLLSELKPERIIFTGGGIVDNTTFASCDALWIHCHPGKLPVYRGSTCFYYSYLNDGTVSCSAFGMTPSLDDGEVFSQIDFLINYPLADNETLFLDYVLDPYIRSKTLTHYLSATEIGFVSDLEPGETVTGLGHPYYVIHPYLRSICARRVQESFSEEMPSGIFPIM